MSARSLQSAVQFAEALCALESAAAMGNQFKDSEKKWIARGARAHTHSHVRRRRRRRRALVRRR